MFYYDVNYVKLMSGLKVRQMTQFGLNTPSELRKEQALALANELAKTEGITKVFVEEIVPNTLSTVIIFGERK